MYVDSSSPRFSRPWFLTDALSVAEAAQSHVVWHVHTLRHVLVCTHTKTYYTHTKVLRFSRSPSVFWDLNPMGLDGWTRRAGRWLVVTPSGPSACRFKREAQPVSLRRLNALKPTELPAFLQTSPDTRQLLLEGAGQPTQKSLHFCGTDLKQQEHQWLDGSKLWDYQWRCFHFFFFFSFKRNI